LAVYSTSEVANLSYVIDCWYIYKLDMNAHLT